MALNTKQKIANFLYYFPDSNMAEIIDNSDCGATITRKLVSQLIKSGDVTHRKNGRTWLYSTSEDYQPVRQESSLAPQPTNSNTVQKCEERINDLLSRGLRRRALTELRRLSALQNSASGIEAVARMASRIR